MFADFVEAEGIRRGAGHVRQFTILGDGAPWIWNIATSKFPEATQIVDLYHAREHLHDLARSLEFMLLDRKEEWLAARLEDLDYGDIDGICNAARAYPLEGVKKDELDAALGYFEKTTRPACATDAYDSRGLFVGSGAVGSAAKRSSGSASNCPASLDHRRRQRHRHAPLPAGQPPRRPDLARTTQPDTGRLTSQTR